MTARTAIPTFVLAALLATGCVGGLQLGGSMGLNIQGALFGATTHKTTQQQTVTATYGHGTATIVPDKVNESGKVIETGGSHIDRKGVSAVLGGVLGKDLGLAVTDAALCFFSPLSCVRDSFRGSADEREELVERFQAAQPNEETTP